MSETDLEDEEIKKYSELREKIDDLRHVFYKQKKVFPNELHIQGSLIDILFQFSREEIKDKMKEDHRFMGMALITHPNFKAEFELKVSYHPLSAEV